MEKLMRFVIEQTTSGKIDKQTAAKMLQLLKKEEWNIQEDIAIIGVASQLPLVNNLDEFWQRIKSNVDFISPYPASRQADIDRYYDYTGLEDTSELKYLDGSYLEEIDKFDYRLFRLSPKEASLMDPYQRLFLQTVWSAIEDAGYGGKKLAKTRTGVFVGYASNAKDSYHKMVFDTNPHLMSDAGVGNVTAMMPSRISYLLDLKGPTMVLDTACSSALVSVHTAAQSLKNGDCEMAIAGSVRMNLLPIAKEYLMFGLESSDGKTRTFDDRSDGAGVGEGIFAIMLKPLKKAIRDRDHIHGVIKGSAINQDGTSIGLTAPNPESQMDVITKAWESANIHPETLAYLEAHGTGTTLGDPLELDGLEKAFRRYTDKRHICAFGSVKTNLGHLFESSGLAGLLKCLMILKHKEIPAHLYFNRPNTKVDWTDSPIYINTKPRKWESADQPMRCGVSSFGFSGTNCHVVLEEAPAIAREGDSFATHIFTLAAKSKQALEASLRQYRAFLADKSDQLPLADVCYTASTGRSHYNYRLALIVRDMDELQQQLAAICESELADYQHPRFFYGEHKVVPPNKTERATGEILEREKSQLSREANEIIQAYREAGVENDKLLANICSSYSKGADVDWETLYKSQAVQKVSLPVYAFEKIRCWLDIPEGTKAVKTATKKLDKFFTMGWKKQAFVPEPIDIEQSDTGVVLLFKDQTGIADQLAAHYRAAGRDVLEVVVGESFAKQADNHYTITGAEQDYHDLIAEHGQTISKVIHLTTVRSGHTFSSVDELEANQQAGVYSLFYLTRAFAAHDVSQEIDVVLLSDYVAEVTGAEELIKPENVTLFGMGKVVRKEHKNLLCRAIDIDEHTSIETLLAEIDRQSEEDVYQVAYRHQSRYVEEFTEVDVEQATDRTLDIRENGVYLITGGTGGIGLEVAKYLTSHTSVNIVLINRSPMPERDKWADILAAGEERRICKKIREIQEIEASGGRVTCYSADVASFDEMKQVIDDVRQTFGQINGIIHGAGVGGAEDITTRQASSFHAVFAPKVQGTWILDELTQADDLDFFVMFSSIATLFSAPGQGDYIAANGYLDSYSSYRNKQGKRTLTVNWSTWKETGMAVEHDFNVDTLFRAILTKDAINGLHTLLHKNIPRALIGEINYESKLLSLIERFMFSLSKAVKQELAKYLGPTKARKKAKGKGATGVVSLSGREQGDYSEWEQQIGQIWADVLGFEDLNIYDNFFEMGGDSILGLKIANLIEEQLGMQVGVTELLTYVTIADFATYFSGLTRASTTRVIEPVAEQDSYPTSSAQKRLYFLHQLDKTDLSYNLPRAVFIEGSIHVARFQQALRAIIARQESLRTSFDVVNGEPVQIIHPEVAFELELIEADESQVQAIINQFAKPFDLRQAPLFRCQLIVCSEQKSILLFDMHHLITDGVSIDVFVNEFVSLYEGRELAPLSIEYKDFATWQNKMLVEGQWQTQENFWLDVFAGDLPVLQLPTDYPRPAVKSMTGQTVKAQIDDALVNEVYRLAKETGTTLYMVLLSAFTTLLSRYSAQEDIIIGSPMAGRTHASLEPIIGMFINTIALRTYPKREKTFQEYLLEVKAHTLQVYENQDYQFDDLVNKLGIERKADRNPLLDVWFVLQNVGVSDVNLRDLQVSPYPMEETTAQFDLKLEVIEKNDTLLLQLNYCTALYQQETAERILQDFSGILQAVCADRLSPLGKLELATSKQLIAATSGNDELDFDFDF